MNSLTLNTHPRRKRQPKPVATLCSYPCGCQRDRLGLLVARCPVADEIHRLGCYAMQQALRALGSEEAEWGLAALGYAADLHAHTKAQEASNA